MKKLKTGVFEAGRGKAIINVLSHHLEVWLV
jgi:hypothetical protein